ncbi:MAG: tRNA pseudouridine(13) synthase TruD [Thaumarchaeota archaeon]|nr:tRNA pseudouridine(13) synthase TruD [Nitrososphaerota archaeon]
MVPELDREVGMECYASSGPPCHALARMADEDFRVEELVSLEAVIPSSRPGYHPLYRVEKRSIDTMHMGDELSAALRSRVSYGGLKDKRAVAIQYVTTTNNKSDSPEVVTRERFSAKLVGYVPTKITRGSVIGNRFRITLRECCGEFRARAEEALELARLGRLPNFFGHQRFGASGVGTHKIGKAIVLRDFEGAVNVMLGPKREGDDAAKEAREAMGRGQFEKGLRLLPPGQDSERAVANSLARNPSDFVKALRAVPPRLRRLYVQAYQSYIFNKMMSRALAQGLDISAYEVGDNWAEPSDDGLGTKRVRGVKDPVGPRAVPMAQLAGYAFRNYGGRFDALALQAMSEDGVSPKDFYVKEMQEASAEGSFRVPHIETMDAKFVVTDQLTATLEFALARGQYATVLLREIIKPEDPRHSGLA